MTSYLTPDVYIHETEGPKPIEAVGTGTAAFLGHAPNPGAPLHKPTVVNSWLEFAKTYVGESREGTHLTNAVRGYFQNGGRRAYIVNVGNNGMVLPQVELGERRGVAALEQYEEISMVAAPGYTDPASYDALLTHCERMANRFAILDAPERIEDLERLTRAATTDAPEPDAEGAKKESKKASGDSGGLRPRTSQNGFGACYFPWLFASDPTGRTITVPPSGHMAGIYAATDAMKGVHVAPANRIVAGATGLARLLTPEEQGPLNQNGINCIRRFPDGIYVWGARTLAPSASEWRYVPIRRFFIMIEESIRRGTRGVVFAPNNEATRKRVVRDVSNLLRGQWRMGALMGRTPAEAFFVKCDEENNPPEERDAGRLNIDVGLATAKPAEFVIFRIGHFTAEANTSMEESNA